MNTQNSTVDYQFFLFSKVYEKQKYDCRKTFEELFIDISISYNKYCKWFGESNYNINDCDTMQYFLINKIK